MITIDWNGAPLTEFSPTFVQGMANRMIVSYAKYGAVADAYPDRVDAVASLKKRLERYEADGNTEWLMDIGNLAMIEFMRPRHPKAHFRATDSQESPGRTWSEGDSQKRNLHDLERMYQRQGD